MQFAQELQQQAALSTPVLTSGNKYFLIEVNKILVL